MKRDEARFVPGFVFFVIADFHSCHLAGDVLILSGITFFTQGFNMKKSLLLAALLATIAAPQAFADVGVFAGVTYVFGANAGVGFTLQATTARHEDRGIAAAGFSYYPFASGNKFGLPVGVGYQTRNAAALVNYDFLMGNVSVGAGYADTRKDHALEPVPAVVNNG
jgi:hypothetical protein